MSSASKGNRIHITVAIIGLVGVLGAAVIANWDKIFSAGKGPGPGPGPGPTVVTVQWTNQASYTGDCTSRPPGKFCAEFDDGYVWLIRGAITAWDTTNEDGRRIHTAITATARHEHIIGSKRVRLVKR